MATKSQTVKKSPVRKPAVKKSTAKKPATKKSAVKKSVMKKPVVKKSPVTKIDVDNDSTKGLDKKESKMDISVKIVEEMFKDYCDGIYKAGDVKKRMIEEAGLTKAGANTYFANIKKKILNDEL